MPIDIILVSNKNNLILSGVGDPFLDQELRYHFPIFDIFKFSKPKFKSFFRQMWRYEHGDYNLLRQKASSIDWDSFFFFFFFFFFNSLNFIYLYKHHKHLYKQWLILHTFIQRDSEGSLSTFVDLYPWK